MIFLSITPSWHHLESTLKGTPLPMTNTIPHNEQPLNHPTTEHRANSPSNNPNGIPSPYHRCNPPKPLRSRPRSPRPRRLRDHPCLSLPQHLTPLPPLSRKTAHPCRPHRLLAVHPDAPQAISSLATRPFQRHLGRPAPTSPLEPRPRALRDFVLRRRAAQIRSCPDPMP